MIKHLLLVKNLHANLERLYLKIMVLNVVQKARLVKMVDVYNIVKTAAEKFNLPIPKIVISNTMVPNAAATGPSPSRGLVLITTGLISWILKKMKY